MKKKSYSAILMEKAENFTKAGNNDAACNLLQEALDIEPENTVAIYRLAKLYASNGNHLKALEFYHKFVVLHPDNLDVHLLLGIEYAEIRNFQEAIDCFLYCIAHSPPKALFHKVCGIAFSDSGNHKDALIQLNSAFQIEPKDDEVLIRLGIELIHFLKMAEAEGHLLHALVLNPKSALAYNNLGRVYKFQGRMDEAIKAFRKALELEPHNYVVADNLLLSLNYLADANPEKVAEEHRQLSIQAYGNNRLDRSIVFAAKSHNPTRIGYVSGDFHNHSVSFFIEPILMHHNPHNVSVYCYSNGTVVDETTQRLMSCNVQWRSIVSLSDQAAAALIHDDKIDILIDLSGHSSGNRLGLFGLKPAPVQASWIGYPHSTGLLQIDYYISDQFCDPPEMTEHLYTEKIIRLPRVFSCYLPPLQFPQVAPPPCAISGVITFGSFNNFAKVNEHVLSAWISILKRVQNSRLFIKSMALGDLATQQQILSMFVKHGIDCSRIALLNTVNSAMEHLELYGQIDIALDTFPYNGTTTTCEALWMGVPVITLAGKTHASRVGLSFLNVVGCPELIAETQTDYVDCAAKLAKDSSILKSYRENLRNMMAISPLMDAKGVTHDIEETFIAMYSKKDNYGKYQSLP